MKIKKFNELFDSEEIKDLVFSTDPSAEIDYLSKNYSKYTKVDYTPDKKTIENLLLKIVNYRYPFMSVFLQADREPNGIIETEDFNIMIRYDEEHNYHAFILADENYMIILSIRVNDTNYDAMLAIYDVETQEVENFEENNITFEDVVNIIENEYISTIKEYGFEEVLGYNYIIKLQSYN